MSYTDTEINLAISLARSLQSSFRGVWTNYSQLLGVFGRSKVYEINARNLEKIIRCAIAYCLIIVHNGDGPGTWVLQNTTQYTTAFTAENARQLLAEAEEKEAKAQADAEAERAAKAEEDAARAAAIAAKKPPAVDQLERLHRDMKSVFSGQPKTRAELLAWIDARDDDDAEVLQYAKEDVLNQMAQSDRFRSSGFNCCCFFAKRYVAVDPSEETTLLARGGYSVNG